MGEKKNPVMSVDFATGYNTLSDEVTNQGRVCIDMASIQSGLIKHIGANKVGLLLTIVSYMDSNGNAFPSQRKLAELTGVSKNTVNKLINELLEVEVDGQKVLRREFIGKGTKKRSLYYIHAGEITNSAEIEKQIGADKRMNSRDVALYFTEVYQETFGNGYVANWGRDLSLIKNKLLPAYKDDEVLTGVIDTAIKGYKRNWSTPKYPLPTIPMLCTWLSNAAYGVYEQTHKEEQEKEERMQKAHELDDTDKALDLF